MEYTRSKTIPDTQDINPVIEKTSLSDMNNNMVEIKDSTMQNIIRYFKNFFITYMPQ